MAIDGADALLAGHPRTRPRHDRCGQAPRVPERVQAA